MSKINKIAEIIDLVNSQLHNIRQLTDLIPEGDHEDLQEELLLGSVNMVNNASNILTSQMYSIVEGDKQTIPIQTVMNAGHMLDQLNLQELDEDYQQENVDDEDD